MRLGTHLATVFDREMASHGLSQAQFRNLLELSHEPISPGDLASRLLLEKATVSLMVSKMVDSGWLERLPGLNRRTHLVAITSAGREVLASALPPAISLAERMTTTYSDDEVEELLCVLGRLESYLRS